MNYYFPYSILAYLIRVYLSCIFSMLSPHLTILPFNNSEAALHFIKRYLPENPVILEAGAFDGTNTLEMSFLWPDGHIYAFEPVQTIYDLFLKKTYIRTNISSFPLALSNKNGTADFFLSEMVQRPGVFSGSGSLLQPKEHLKIDLNVMFNKKIKVKTITLKKWCEDNHISKIDFMWLDMQGYELPMLKESSDILKTARVIYTEANFIEGYKNQYIYNDYVTWFEKNGFSLVARDTKEDYCVEDKALKKYNIFGLWFCNAIFINNRYFVSGAE